MNAPQCLMVAIAGGLADATPPLRANGKITAHAPAATLRTEVITLREQFMGRTVTRQVTGGWDAAAAPGRGERSCGGARARLSAARPEKEGLLTSVRRPAPVLAAKPVRPDYVSGDSFRFLVISDGKVMALAKTADEAGRAAGPSARWPDLGDACGGPGVIDTHIHALQAAAD